MPKIVFAWTVLPLLALLPACSIVRPDQPLMVASGFASHHLCSETFISGLDTAQVFQERVLEQGAIRYLKGLMHYELDRDKRQVTTSIAGFYKSSAVYDDQYGCVVIHGDAAPALKSVPASVPAAVAGFDAADIAGPAVVETHDARLGAALDKAFADRAQAPYIHTKAIVVVKDGKIVAERYAPGVGVDTPLLGFSMTKSITNALIGILSRQGKLQVGQPAAFAAWQGKDDVRGTITIDQLLRQTAGLALEQDNSGYDVNSRMMFLERDMAGFAQTAQLKAKPGSEWAYTDGNFMLLSRIIRDAVGGHAADVNSFAQRELFAPTGMRHAKLDFDATGTPLGANYSFATARDWARFGLLYLNDGVAGGKRILPEGWVKYSSTQTLNTGYGAGFWINGVAGDAPWGLPWGMRHVPADAFFAMGFMGQHVVIVPSQHLVVVRLGMSHHSDGLIGGADRLVAEVIAALEGETASVAAR